MRSLLIALPILLLAALFASRWQSESGSAAPGDTERVSVDSNGNEGTGGDSENPAISGDGRYVFFGSDAVDLVGGDGNGTSDLFVHDRQTGDTDILSDGFAGDDADGGSYNPATTPEGRYVAFESNATNLVPGDTMGFGDIFVHDRQSGDTERVSVDSMGNEADADSDTPSISADGRYVAFSSLATNLVTNDDNEQRDIFVHDRQTDVTERVNVSTAGDQAEERDSFGVNISADGRYVAFDSAAPNLVQGDGNDATDVFLRDRVMNTTTLISVNTNGDEGDASSFAPALDSSGRYVAFTSQAADLVADDNNGATDIFLRDLQTGATERVNVDSMGNETLAGFNSFNHAISGDGRFVLFDTGSPNLVAGDGNGVRDAFVHDRESGVTQLISRNSDGVQGSGNSFGSDNPGTLSADGRYATFTSDAIDLVPSDSNNDRDVFVHDLGEPQTPTPTPSPTASPSAGPSDTVTPSPATPTGSASPTDEPSPSDTPGPGTETTWGNANCSGPGGMDPADPVDSLLTLRADAGLDANTGDCPELGTEVDVLNASLHLWGDVDCSGALNPVDSLNVLRFDAGLSVAQGEDCPAMGAQVTIVEG